MKAKLVKHESGFILYDEDNITIGAKPNVLSSNIFSKLSLKNCQAIERGYDLHELAVAWAETVYEEIADNVNILDSEEIFIADTPAFKAGFQKALEILGDKKFSEEDIRKAMDMITHVENWDGERGFGQKYTEDEIIQSLQQTEWDVTFNPDELDADGCLILKRI